MIEIRQYQQEVQEAIGAIIAAGKKRIIVVAPTGSGKTIIASDIIKRAATNGLRVLFLAHRKELIWQTSEKLTAIDVPHGIIMADYPHDSAQLIQVGSVQSVHAKGIRRSKIDLPRADILILDEAHHVASSKQWITIIEKYPDAFVLGLTATPINRKGIGLAGYFDEIVRCPSITELTHAGFLVPARYYAPSIPDLKGLHIRAGDYVEEELSNRMDQPKLIGDIAENWSRICPERKTIVFGCSIKHSVHIAETFRGIGVKAEHLDGSTNTEERSRVVESFKNGDTQILSNCGLFLEGFDCPAASALIFARPTKSLLLYLQVAGRVLRPYPGKSDCIVIDHAGAVYEHGLLNQDFDWKLESGPGDIEEQFKLKQVRAKKTITCGNCKSVYHGRLTCPECSWKPMVRGKPVETFAAYLQEIDKIEKPEGTTDRRIWWSGLKWWASQRNYKMGWASYKFKDRFNTWPPISWKDDMPYEPPKDVLSWIRSRQIAYARSWQMTERRIA